MQPFLKCASPQDHWIECTYCGSSSAVLANAASKPRAALTLHTRRVPAAVCMDGCIASLAAVAKRLFQCASLLRGLVLAILGSCCTKAPRTSALNECVSLLRDGRQGNSSTCGAAYPRPCPACRSLAEATQAAFSVSASPGMQHWRRCCLVPVHHQPPSQLERPYLHHARDERPQLAAQQRTRPARLSPVARRLAARAALNSREGANHGPTSRPSHSECFANRFQMTRTQVRRQLRLET